MNNQDYIQVLVPFQEEFRQSKEEILSKWADFPVISEIFDKHQIDKMDFVDRFASGVFDYFMRLIAKEVSIGRCPVIEEFLLYLKDVDITSAELFEICTHFKRSMIDFTYKKNFNSQDVFNAITHIFDRNFSSVLKFYSDTIYAKEQEIVKNMELLGEYKKAIDESSFVYKVNNERKITYVNDKLLELSGYDIDEVIGASYDFMRYDEKERQQCSRIWEEVEEKGIYRGVVKNRTKDGGYFYLQITMMKLYNPHENEEEFIIIAYDVTKLIDARIEAIKASEAKEYFLSNMSHEIRTPLNAILGFVSLLLDEEKDAVHKRYLEIISKSGETLLSIINDILDFSKIRSGEFVIEPVEFYLYEELQSVIDLFRASALEKEIDIVYEFQNDMPMVLKADILRIKQIVSNFLSNAVKFTPERGRIAFEVTFKDNILHMSVTDNGIGIKKENLSSIFNAFSQVDNHSMQFGGTGLGLSISYQLTKLMGGTIDVESIFGLGSKFSVTIPVEVVKNSAIEQRSGMRKTIPEPISLQGRILIADDNEANRELVKVFLMKMGVEFDEAADGLEVLELFKNRRYDLILMDEQMPNMNGKEAVAKIREYEKLFKKERTPIVALTANVINGENEYTLEQGFDGFLGKPLNLWEFQRVLKRHLQEGRLDDKKSKKEICNQTQGKIKGLDEEFLYKELALNEEELIMLLELFLKKRDDLLEKLEDAISIRSYEEIARLAHNIKGSSGNFRLEEVQNLAALIEDKAKEQNELFDYQKSFDSLVKKLMAIEIL